MHQQGSHRHRAAKRPEASTVGRGGRDVVADGDIGAGTLVLPELATDLNTALNTLRSRPWSW